MKEQRHQSAAPKRAQGKQQAPKQAQQAIQQHQHAPLLSKAQLLAGGGALLTTGVIEAFSHNPEFLGLGLIASLGVGALTPGAMELATQAFMPHDPDDVRRVTERLLNALPMEDRSHLPQDPISKLKRLFHIGDQEEDEDDDQAQPKDDRQPAYYAPNDLAPSGDENDQGNAFAGRYENESGQDDEGPERLTLEEIIEHTETNGYELPIGRSLTKANAPAVYINILEQHLKLIGASRKGKSSMAAFILDLLIHTHDRKHILIAMLDLEYKTSRLFEQAANIATLRVNGDTTKLHAKTPEQCLEMSGYIVQLLNKRYELDELAIDSLPVLIVYVEEFLDLKDHFKRQIDQATNKAEKDQATTDYNQLVSNISKIARRGLKVRIQLLLCAQVDYRDDDFREALLNMTAGFSFAVQPPAARASGFYNNALLTRNAINNQPGQAVLEHPDCKDLILAPEYDLKAKLLSLARTSNIHPMRQPETFAHSPKGTRTEQPQDYQNTLEIDQIDDSDARTQTPVRQPEDTTRTSKSDVLPKYRLSDEQIIKFCTLYPEHIANKDRCLQSLGLNTNYRAHANEIIQQYALDRKRG